MNQINLTKLPVLDYPTTEALNTLCTNISFSGKSTRVIMNTSCRAGEGKSFLTMNLMRALAGEGKNVVLVDADIRRSTIVKTYAENPALKPKGLAHYLADLCSWEDILYQTNIEGAYLIFHGRSVANPHALLTTDKLNQLITQLLRSFDIVLVDTPPIGLVVDAAEIAKCCHGVLLTVTNGVITRKELSDAVAQIQRTGCPILGVVMNKVTFDTHSSRSHYYKTYYSHYKSGYYGEKEKSSAG
ncbi:tyrosine-protein kinase CpsD [Clostridia bacterium]|nr:tyrosine-protein kinase CpsD [Clostridia bacterium]